MGPMTKAKKKHYNLVASEMNAITNSFMNDIMKQAPKKFFLIPFYRYAKQKNKFKGNQKQNIYFFFSYIGVIN